MKDYKKKSKVPFFSICIPVYNVEKYLKECIESVLQQTDTDYEIILIDDGSKDKSAEICDEYSKRYNFIKVVHKENAGLLLARDDAVKISEGKYLLFLDADDIFYPGILTKIRNVIESLNADMVFFDFKRFISGHVVEIVTEQFEDKTIFEGKGKRQLYLKLVTEDSFNSVCRKCIQRNVYDWKTDYSLYKGMIQGEDAFLSLPFLDNAKCIVYLKDALYGYRTNLESISYNMTLKNYKDMQYVFERMQEYILLWNLPQVSVIEQKKKILICGMNCILSIMNRISQKESTKEELEAAIYYIGNDAYFKSAFKISGSLIPWYKRIICRWLMEMDVRSLTAYLKIYEILKKLRRF